mmetsp:Transcript_22780/g.64032  ORF Transcript_22780/g.64032 Transcript_22780/m.64032 type:complete len:326 (+) Transcript_22780:119-1096(+)|eukprot:CAMPEP_0119132568 /NCGR_PEP_ID=MMETSP1310-20130426/11904_1 /TAXON_ID=464262 /ORGANISM="Genus nov. species nov., Strain RCC2339" /LENGTH=325 /DNA_ID=CAMNT_0007123205 /DNA_START=60 /DNA_END=1037 /DNA_ORIENTATION=-
MESRLLERRKFAILGANGFIGSHIARQLVCHDFDVHAIVRSEITDRRVSWLADLPRMNAVAARLVLFQATAPDQYAKALAGCDACFIAAGINDPAHETWPAEMVGLTEAVVRQCAAAGVKTVVLTSSTGSTNPPGGEPERKREDEHFSDPEVLRERGRFASCAKTLAERKAFELGAELGVRAVAICPSAVMGPSLSPVRDQPHDFIARFLTGEKKLSEVPNNSMSFIDVRDLAALHVQAALLPTASGRYFGVCSDSAHFLTILQMLHELFPPFKVPPSPSSPLVRVTAFDLSKQATLGVSCRPIKEVLRQHIMCLQNEGVIPLLE